MRMLHLLFRSTSNVKFKKKKHKAKKKEKKNNNNGVYSLGFLFFYVQVVSVEITCAPIDDDGLWIYDIIS